MCTLILATRVWEDVPVLVAANRDERLDRASAPPELRTQGGVRFLAPRDLEGGGTWLGMNRHGLFVGLTNRFPGLEPGPRSSAPPPRSRGLLVLDALAERSSAHVARRLRVIDPGRHAGFHLVAADREEAHLVWSDGKRLHHEPLVAGIHVVTERSLGAAPTQRLELLHRRISQAFGEPAAEPWIDLLRAHADPPLEGVCVHAPERDYGTRSSTIAILAADPTKSRLLHADGPPCTTPYVDRSEELQRLLGGR